MAEAVAPALRHANPRGFDDTRVWVFDLDNTLYPAHCDLFAQIHDRMGSFISQLMKIDRTEAYKLQKKYYHEHGTTLAGLMSVDGINPQHFLDHVHDIDYSPVPHMPALVSGLQALPGRKLIFTNGSRRHAENVTNRLGVTHLIEDIFDITDANYVPKPRAEPYHHFLTRHGVNPQQSAMFEDLPGNLAVPAQLGMTTVLIGPGRPGDPGQGEIKSWQNLPDHIHHITDDLPGFLVGGSVTRSHGRPVPPQ
jgi:putative hydrolase of the HAD superfamily